MTGKRGVAWGNPEEVFILDECEQSNEDVISALGYTPIIDR
jgi:hypothetical protein